LPRHFLLLAIVYLRQSTAEQVRLNLESQRRQYALRDRAIALGWGPERVKVIDEGLGRSGGESGNRTGFQGLISEVALGHVGIIFALEASRLARNNEDWQHLLRLCAVTNTLIADAENVHDPRLRDDRILLGVKGQLSEWELDTLRDRLVTGAENKALRGELYTKVPSRYVLSADLVVEQHPDEAVRGAITAVFQRFREQGSACATARTLREDGVMLPLRQDAYGRKPPRWSPPTFVSVHNILTNPFYAGAYAYGRSRVVASATPEGEILKRIRQVPFGQWSVCLVQHHPGYTSWEEFLENQSRLRANRRGFSHPGPVGEGPSLLAGILRRGPCGRSMNISYGGPHHDAVHFRCSRVDPVLESLWCQSFGGMLLEQRVSVILMEVLGPHGMEATLLALKDWEKERARQVRQWDLEVTRAEEAEARARRKYEEVEPGHRLVSRTMEQAWEKTLQALGEACRTRDLRRTQIPPALTEEEQRNLRRSGHDLEELWKDPRTSWKDRKENVRLLIHHVEAWSDVGAGRLTFRIHWTTGKITEDHVPLARAGSGA
jgi:DNA invertase Pin-like site-specific DNA recombinase